ncbi:MAG: hypothetical protein WCF23_12275 [Candidatus Nitrosopolaris sp.]
MGSNLIHIEEKRTECKDGRIWKDKTVLDEKRRVTFAYVNSDNQITEVKIPLDGFEMQEGVNTRTDQSFKW